MSNLVRLYRMGLRLNTALVDDWRVNYLEFDNGKLVVKKLILGEIINSVPGENAKPKILPWKQKISEGVFKAKLIHDLKSDSTFAVSLSFKFHPKYHTQHKLDVENYVKPVMDGIAAGLFSTDPLKVTKFNFDDSNFKHLLIEKLDNPLNPSDEGVAIVVAMAN